MWLWPWSAAGARTLKCRYSSSICPTCMHSGQKRNLGSEKDRTVKSRTAIRAQAVTVENCRQAGRGRSWQDNSSAGRPAVDAVTGWDEILLLAGGVGQPSTVEPLPNFGEIAPHIV